MKRLSITALAVAAVGFSGVALANGATPTTITSPKAGELFYKNTINFSANVDAAAPLGGANGIVWVVMDRSEADEGCRGADVLFGNIGGASDHAELVDGKFSAEIDFAGLGNGKYCLAINNRELGPVAEEIRRDVVDIYVVGDYAKVSGGFRWEPVGTTSPLGGKSPTHAFDGVVGDAGAAGVVGAITVNYRELNTYCTFTPGKLTFYDAAGNADVASGIWAVLTDMAGECTDGADTPNAAIGIFPKDAVFADDKRVDDVTETPRGAIHLRWGGVPSTSQYDIDATPGSYGVDSWILLERGNAEVGTR